MKQTFELPEHSEALFFPAQFSFENEVGDTLTDETGYENVERITYTHNSHLGTDLEPFYTVVIKGRYQLPSASEIWTDDNDQLDAIRDLTNAPRLQAHGNSATINFADDVNSDSDGLKDPVYVEHDLAIVKRSADIIVKRFRNVSLGGLSSVSTSSYEYEVHAKNQLWLRRILGDTNPDTINWFPRFKSPRKPSESMIATEVRLTTSNAHFQGNTSRHIVRSIRNKLTQSDKVLLTREREVDAKTYLTTYRFQMPEAAPRVHYYTYCGHGKDEASRWCKESVSVSIDTLEVFPDNGYVDISWRGYWRSDLPIERYRELKIQFDGGA
ncbi:hypothetical protein [Pleionea sp. CnH1-48]|uniref:hypothetical protein n=1 Tax=Pleionea sp. CnH1-48 TaxID=2954494 RepID=UPI002097BC81|nr:hypothetical protein [Pleionea sp. CnH1-48]MCO7223325.1 hypothetical protein [Pleionea sp. CnH1-48]